MAYMIDKVTQVYIPLVSHHILGRQVESVHTLINSPFVSKIHAAIEWRGLLWRIKNLGVNGTWVNGISLIQGQDINLKINDVIHFSDLANAGFKIIDLSPPADALWPLQSDSCQLEPMRITPTDTLIQPVYLSPYHLLPDNDAPELAIYYSEQEQQWYLEFVNGNPENKPLVLRSGAVVTLANKPWLFLPGHCYNPTEIGLMKDTRLNDYEFIFNVSLDEETTQLELQRHTTYDLGVRSHHTLLMQLARHRSADAIKGIDVKSQGWVYSEQLACELGIDVTLLNIHIFRLRKQLADSFPHLSAQQQFIERRGGKIRFGCERFKIYKGSTLTAQLPPMAVLEVAAESIV